MKYIIEVPDAAKRILMVSANEKAEVWSVSIDVDNLEVLNADYVNEHFSVLQDDAYNAGFENGKKEAESSEAIEHAKADAFNKGMLFKEEKIHDAFLRGVEKGKAVNDKGCDGCKYAEMGSDTTICSKCCNAYHNQWTAKSDKIEVGDEVKWNSDVIVVTRLYKDGGFDWCDGIGNDGRDFHILEKNARKTGRHFDIKGILEAMHG